MAEPAKPVRLGLGLEAGFSLRVGSSFSSGLPSVPLSVVVLGLMIVATLMAPLSCICICVLYDILDSHLLGWCPAEYLASWVPQERIDLQTACESLVLSSLNPLKRFCRGPQRVYWLLALLPVLGLRFSPGHWCSHQETFGSSVSAGCSVYNNNVLGSSVSADCETVTGILLASSGNILPDDLLPAVQPLVFDDRPLLVQQWSGSGYWRGGWLGSVAWYHRYCTYLYELVTLSKINLQQIIRTSLVWSGCSPFSYTNPLSIIIYIDHMKVEILWTLVRTTTRSTAN